MSAVARPLILVLLLLAALAAVLWVALAHGGGVPGPEGFHGAADERAMPKSPASAGPQVQVRTPVPGAVDARPPTVHLRITDRVSGQPVPEAGVHLLRGREWLGVSGLDGAVALHLDGPKQLVIAAKGYLFRLCAAQPGSTAERPQRVELVRDRYTHAVGFRFTGPTGEPVGDVAVRFRLLSEPDDAAAMGPRGDAVLVRAWSEHSLIASASPVAGERVQLGRSNQGNVHHLRGEDQMRFLQVGIFELQAATLDGLVARATFGVEAGENEALTVPMVPGEVLEGQVVRGDSGQPLSGAHVQVEGDDPLELRALTDASGRFHLGPLHTGMVHLRVRHVEMEDATHGPVDATSDDVVVAMQPLQTEVFVGRVVVLPARSTAEGAEVAAVGHLGQTLRTRTDALGRFRLRLARESTRLSIALPGYLLYSELIDPEQRFSEFALIPEAAAVRVRSGMTAVLRGHVVDGDDRPVPDSPVRLQPETPTIPPGLADRRIITGGSLSLPTVVTTDSNGAFTMETQHSGSVWVFPVDGVTKPREGRSITVTLGTTVNDLRLVSRRER